MTPKKSKKTIEIIECPHCREVGKPYIFEQRIFAYRKERVLLCGSPECKKVYVDVDPIK